MDLKLMVEVKRVRSPTTHVHFIITIVQPAYVPMIRK